jgi:gamma-glutamylcyclotransferase (GGCT)/AIG2-like uncharacterized protein YtfP
MKMGDLLFVYGTLRREGGCHGVLNFGATFVTDEYVAGTMYDVGRFPALTLEGDTHIRGEVYRIDNPELPARLDRYEGCPNLYQRRKVRTIYGHDVWVYVFVRPVEGLPVVKSGDWLKEAA